MTAPSLQSQLRGANRLCVDASVELTRLVEEMHRSLSPFPAHLLPTAISKGNVYETIRTIIGLIGAGVDIALASMPSLASRPLTATQLETLRCALNGVVGDHLAATGNPLAIDMRLRHQGAPLALSGDRLAAAIPRPSRKLLVMVHGLCLGDMHWGRGSGRHDEALAQALGYTPIHLRYNSGLHISTNGGQAAQMLEALAAQWPVKLEEVAIVGHSMGGLLARSACDVAETQRMRWIEGVRKLVFLGAPHHGAPLERGGYWLHMLLGRYALTAPLARLGRMRSAGITDLRRGCLRDEDWRQRDRFEDPLHPVSPVPLPEGVDCYALAGAIRNPHRTRAAQILGDGLVPIDSAFGDHEDPQRSLGVPHANRHLAHRIGHLAMLEHREVGGQIFRWLSERRRSGKVSLIQGPPRKRRSRQPARGRRARTSAARTAAAEGRGDSSE